MSRASNTLAVCLAVLAVTGTLPTIAATADRSGPSSSPPSSASSSIGAEVLVGVDGVDPALAPGEDFRGGEVIRVNRVLDVVAVEPDASVDAYLDRVRDDPDVRYAETNGVVHALETPDDPRLADQYGPQQIRAPAAWNTTFGSTSKNVCVVDTGVRATHEEVRNRVVDGIDVYHGDDEPEDTNSHGTHVAGTAVGAADNGRGIAGVSNAGLLVAKIFGSGDTTDTMTAANGIQWCADHGADVISMSFGSPLRHPVLRDAVEYAWNRGDLLVSSAGNRDDIQFDEYTAHRNGRVTYPAAYEEVIAVACTTPSESRCTFSSQGPQTEIAAPGSGVLSASWQSDDGYLRKSGTSMAAPHVSGAAALVWSWVPGLSNEDLRGILQATARDIGPDGRDRSFGHGLLDVAAALDEAKPLRQTPCHVASPQAVHPLQGTSSFAVETQPAGAVEEVKVYLDDRLAGEAASLDDDGTFSVPVDSGLVDDGVHDVDVECRAGAGGGEDVTRGYHYASDNLVVGIDEPTEGATVAGDVTIEVAAAAHSSAVDEVRVRVDGDPLGEATDPDGDGTYAITWDSTEHVEESQPASIQAVVQDDEGITESTGERTVTVDNKPDPGAEILDPAADDTVVGYERVRVQAPNGTGVNFSVEVWTPSSGWNDVTDNRLENDTYYYDWVAVNEPDPSTVRARVIDTGGQAGDNVTVPVTGTGTVGNALLDAVESIPCLSSIAQPQTEVPCPIITPLAQGGN